MTDSRAAVGMDRLPWLADDPKPHSGSKLRELAGWGFAAALLIAGSSFWRGKQSGSDVDSGRMETPAEPRATIQLPEPRPVTIEPEVQLPAVPELQPAPVPTVRIAEPSTKPAHRLSSRSTAKPRKLSPMDMKESDLAKTVSEQEGTQGKSAVANAPSAKSAPITAAPPASMKQLRLWPSRQASGAYGRLVQIGAFGTRLQAKQGWRRMTRSYPAVGRLPAVVVESRNSRGKRFYRFQIGTTSQAHSEVLCQRMASIRFSCAVVGLPWKAKVER